MYGYSDYKKCRRVAQELANTENKVLLIYKNLAGTWGFQTVLGYELITCLDDLVLPEHNLKYFNKLNKYQQHWFKCGVVDKLRSKPYRFNKPANNPFSTVCKVMQYASLVENEEAYSQGFYFTSK